jgi:catechol 2,3-dioxygenase-like lactoylglutathione lyase family enzyme
MGNIDQAAESNFECISAITLMIADMAVSVAFYKALGMTVRYGGENASFTSLHAGSAYVNLASSSEVKKTSFWGRVIFYVNDVDALHKKILAAGYPTETQPADSSWGERFFHIRDPDNHQLSMARLL